MSIASYSRLWRRCRSVMRCACFCRIVQGWNATTAQNGLQVTARNASWNGVLGTGAEAGFGFNGSWTGSNAAPTSFTLNGTTCTGRALRAHRRAGGGPAAPQKKGMPVSLSRTQFGKAAPASAALATTGVVGFPRAAWAANTASTGQPNSFSTYTSGIRLRNTVEAPLLQKTNEGGWRLWGDSFSPVNNDRIGRIDPYLFDPYREQLWRMVPGLADSNAVSFESVNLPDNYLRHRNYVLRIDPISSLSSAADRQDATFRVTS